MRVFRIGQIAKRAGVGVETVRYYEQQGLLEEPDRKESGYRQYNEEVVARIRFIRKAKELGFTLKEIKELLSLQYDPTATCVEVKSRAEAKIADLEDKIRTLQRMKKALVQVTKVCPGTGPTSDCPILDELQAQEN